MRFSSFLCSFCICGLIVIVPARRAHAITIDTVPVGSPGNANDPATSTLFSGYGSVGYNYNIGTYEVTIGQYAAFLNAVAATDTYGLYNPFMATNENIAGIAQNGSFGSYTYSVIGSANHPITYVSWGDAARFANWLSNGQPTGTQGSGTTETGSYALNGATSDAALNAVTRNTSATWVIPTENEWYKAAYYQPTAQGGDSDNYWAYPTRSNNAPYSAPPPGGSAPTPSNTANFLNDDGVANGYDDGYAVTGSTNYSTSQNYLTDGGAYSQSSSFYGTFDQGGNVWEWNEALFTEFPARGIRGGSWGSLNGASLLQASWFSSNSPTSEVDLIGFRVAIVPEPGSIVLAAIALLFVVMFCRSHRIV